MPDEEILKNIIDSKKFKRKVGTEFSSPYFFCGKFGTNNPRIIRDYSDLESKYSLFEKILTGMGIFTTGLGAVILLLAVFIDNGNPEAVISVAFIISGVLTMGLLIYCLVLEKKINEELRAVEEEIASEFIEIKKGGDNHE